MIVKNMSAVKLVLGNTQALGNHGPIGNTKQLRCAPGGLSTIVRLAPGNGGEAKPKRSTPLVKQGRR